MKVAELARRSWFYLLLPALLAVLWVVASNPNSPPGPAVTEGALLFDCLVTVPVLYFLFLRSRTSLRPAIIRSLGLGIALLAFVGWAMPDGTGTVFPMLAWLRSFALPLIILVECAAIIALLKYAYGRSPDPQKLADMGVPPILAKLMIAEARFWRNLWHWLNKPKD